MIQIEFCATNNYHPPFVWRALLSRTDNRALQEGRTERRRKGYAARSGRTSENKNQVPLRRSPWRRHGPGLDRQTEGKDRADARGMDARNQSERSCWQ